MPRILRFREYRSRPWKNGGGVTLDIALHPQESGLEAFEWRVSMARVAQDGPFSSFEGIDRTLLVLSGGALTLQSPDGEARLTSRSDPYSFPGERPIRALVEAGPIVDLNVMTRRGKASHRVRRAAIHGTQRLVAGSSCTLVVALDAGLSVGQQALDEHDTLLLSRHEATQFVSAQPAHVAIIEID